MKHKKRILIIAASFFVVIAGFFTTVVAMNPAPEMPRASDAVDRNKPFMVKIHADWCTTCLAVKGVWSDLSETYKDRVRFVVFDVTNKERVMESEREAKRLGMEEFFATYWKRTGTIAILSGHTRDLVKPFYGERKIEPYQAVLKGVFSNP